MSDNHAHEHGISKPKKDYTKSFAIGVFLNVAFVLIEFIYGYIAHSMSLMSDAGHNLSDVLGLLLAWFAYSISKKARDKKFTYGLRSSTLLAALVNYIFLFMAVGILLWQSFDKFFHPSAVDSSIISVVALIGIFVNTATALLFLRDRKTDLNINGAYIHMMADAAVSFAVFLGGFAIRFTNFLWIDPLLGILVNLFIIKEGWKYFRESLFLNLHSVPEKINLSEVEYFFKNLPFVKGVHSLHIWALSTTETALTVHLFTPDGYPGKENFEKIQHELLEHFGIQHTTIQIELEDINHQYSLDEGN